MYQWLILKPMSRRTSSCSCRRAQQSKGVDPTKHLLKQKKNLYGLKNGQVTWHEHIKAGLLSRGFRQSKVDLCLFIKGTVILVLYVDDAALFSPDSAAINREIDSSRSRSNSPMKANFKTTWGPA